jgi:hypothetical protein
MIDVLLGCFAPGRNKAEYSLDFVLPGVPRPGDYISVARPGVRGTEDFIVRRCWWSLNAPEAGANGDVGTLDRLIVECEYALSSHSTPQHRQECLAYERETGVLLHCVSRPPADLL